MMRFKKSVALVIGLAVATLFTAYMVRAQGRGRLETKTITIHQRTATSTFFSAAFNFVPDGSKGDANMAIYRGEGSRGSFTGEGVSQSFPVFTSPGVSKMCTLPDGAQGIELALVGHLASTKFERTGDLLFERGDAGDLIACLNPVTMTFHETGKVKIVGGTGDFAGAHGEETVIQDGGLLSSQSARGAFGFSKGSFVATFTVPNK